jgi:hypothetical protein
VLRNVAYLNVRESPIDHLIKIKEAQIARAVRLIETLRKEIDILKNDQ